MTLQDLGALGEVIGAIAVVISIIYLTAEVRHNTRALQGTMYQSIITSSGDFNHVVGSDAALADLWMRASGSWENLEPHERAQILHLWHHNFRLFENVFFQHAMGTLPDQVWEGWRDLALVHFRSPGVQEWWPSRRRAYSAAFREFLEDSETPVDLWTPTEMGGTREHVKEVAGHPPGPETSA